MQHSRENIMHSLLHMWYTSFDLFEPKELGLLCLVTLNTMVRSSALVLYYFSWWLLVWAGYIDLYIDGSGIFCHLWEYATPLYYAIGFEPRLYLLTLAVSVFIFLLAVRSSLEAKRFSYFIRHTKRLVFFLPLFFVLPHIYIFPVFWLSSFFLLDARHSVRGFVYSLYNGVVLSTAYAPFLICIGAAHGVLFHIHRFLWEMTSLDEYHFAPYAAKYTTSLVLYLFFVTMLYAFYARVVQANSANTLFLRLKHTHQ